jgi:predicted DNA-binding transcriptional regulator AlpA
MDDKYRDELLTTADLAGRWHTSEQAVYAARHRGDCPRAIRIGKRLLFRMSDVLAWEEERAETPSGWPPRSAASGHRSPVRSVPVAVRALRVGRP